MPNLVPIEVLVVPVLFGTSRLPDLACGVGQSIRAFRAEVKAPDFDRTGAGRAD